MNSRLKYINNEVEFADIKAELKSTKIQKGGPNISLGVNRQYVNRISHLIELGYECAVYRANLNYWGVVCFKKINSKKYLTETFKLDRTKIMGYMVRKSDKSIMYSRWKRVAKAGKNFIEFLYEVLADE